MYDYPIFGALYRITEGENTITLTPPEARRLLTHLKLWIDGLTPLGADAERAAAVDDGTANDLSQAR